MLSLLKSTTKQAVKVDIDHLQFLWQKSSFAVYKKFGINSSELAFLRALYYSQRLQKRSAISKEIFYRELSGNCRRWGKYDGCKWGLLRKGLIGSFEYIRSPGSEAIGVSDLGLAAIREHNASVEALFARFPDAGFDINDIGRYYRQTA